jgi:phosphatidylinositol glycan class M
VVPAPYPLSPLLLGAAWGKHLFTAVDLSIALLLLRMLRDFRGLSERAAATATAAFLLHPFVINISTRGNADSIVCAFVLAAVDALARRRTVWAGVWLGLAVHFKIYPIVYALPMVLFIDRVHYPLASSAAVGDADAATVAAHKRARQTEAQATGEEGDSGEKAEAESAALLGSGAVRKRPTSASAGDSATGRVGGASSAAGSDTHGSSSVWSVHGLSAAAVDFFSWERIKFGLCAAGTFFALTGLCYWLYGFVFLWESTLYHFARTDNRHNFSPYFYDLYLRWTEAGPGGAGAQSRVVAGLVSFLPQFGTVLALGIRYHRDLPFALFMQTWVFVAWNKVITVQYFHWYLCLLPLVLPQTRLTLWPKAALLGAAWLLTELNWSVWAGPLEALGQSTFLHVWAAGLLFFLANIAILAALLTHHRFVPLLNYGRFVRVEQALAAAPGAEADRGRRA